MTKDKHREAADMAVNKVNLGELIFNERQNYITQVWGIQQNKGGKNRQEVRQSKEKTFSK